MKKEKKKNILITLSVEHPDRTLCFFQFQFLIQIGL
jgi:hypothetical protein